MSVSASPGLWKPSSMKALMWPCVAGRATEAMGSVYGLLDMTVYGRQETFEESPPGWPQLWRNTGEQWRVNGRPTVQWPRLAVGRSDDLGASTLSG